MSGEKCKISSDLSLKQSRNFESFEEFVNKSIENCALNAIEGRQILKRLKENKGTLSQNTKEKLLEVAMKGGWNQIAYKLDPEYRKKLSPIPSSSISDQTKTISTQGENTSESEDSETLTTKIELVYFIQMLNSQKDQIQLSKKWDEIGFLNENDKKYTIDIINQMVLSLGYLINNPQLRASEVKQTIENELSTAEGGTLFVKNREKMRNFMMSFFSGDQFISHIKQKTVGIMRENLGTEQLKYIFEMEFGKKYEAGIEPNQNNKWLLEAYENALDPKNEWGTVSDASKNQVKSFFAYDVTSMVASGAGTGALLKGGTTLAMKSGKIAGVVDKVNMAGKPGKILSAGALAGVEGTTFTALHEGIRNQEWFLNQNDVTKKVVFNSLMFSTFRLVDAVPLSFFKGLENKNTSLHKLIDGLYNQGIVAPAIYVSAMMGYEHFTNSEKKTLNEWIKEFILVGILGGVFHLSGVGTTKIIEGLGTKAKIDTQTGILTIQKPDGKDIVVDMPKAQVEKIVAVETVKTLPKIQDKTPEVLYREKPGVEAKVPKELPEKTPIAQAVSIAYKEVAPPKKPQVTEVKETQKGTQNTSQQPAQKEGPVPEKTSLGIEAKPVEKQSKQTADKAKTPERVSYNGNLVDFFQGAKVNQNNQLKLILMQGPKGNIRIDFGFKGEIKGGFVMINGESTIFTVNKGIFTMKPDSGKITQEDIINLVKQYKPNFTQ